MRGKSVTNIARHLRRPRAAATATSARTDCSLSLSPHSLSLSLIFKTCVGNSVTRSTLYWQTQFYCVCMVVSWVPTILIGFHFLITSLSEKFPWLDGTRPTFCPTQYSIAWCLGSYRFYNRKFLTISGRRFVNTTGLPLRKYQAYGRSKFSKLSSGAQAWVLGNDIV